MDITKLYEIVPSSIETFEGIRLVKTDSVFAGLCGGGLMGQLLLPGDSKPIKSIVIWNQIGSILDDKELKVLMYHEYGHNILGHLDGQTGIVDNINFEFEADKIASNANGAVSVISMLEKLREQLLKFEEILSILKADFMPASISDELQTKLNEQINARLKALH